MIEVRRVVERMGLDPAWCIPLGGGLTLTLVCFEVVSDAGHRGRTPEQVRAAFSGQ